MLMNVEQELRKIIEFGNIHQRDLNDYLEYLDDGQKRFVINIDNQAGNYRTSGGLARTPNLDAIQRMFLEFCQRFMN